MSGTPTRPGCSSASPRSSVVVVFFQIGVVSEVPVFGVNADLSPLLVAFVGLLCGSTIGAVTGFAVGLLVDLTLVQTLGVTSLIFTLDRLLGRAPARAARPAGGAHAAAGRRRGRRRPRSVGYSLMEFLLGVDAPVSLELLRQIVLGTVVEHDHRAADVGDRAPLPRGRRCPRIRGAGAGAAPTRPAG